jgi:hypothetical protein
MVKQLARQEERRGTRLLFMGIGVFVLVLGASFFWLWSPTSNKSDRLASTGERSEQVRGSSTAAKRNSPPPSASSINTNPETVGHAQDITASATKELSLTAEQRKAVNDFAGQNKSRTMQPDFTISVGAAVPNQIQLGDLPVALTDALTAYSGDQFLLVPSELVIVERDTRRIVAVIPIGT